jgi:hypothetical protein
MTDTTERQVPEVRRPRLRLWRGEGKRRTLGGRWDKVRIAEVLEETRAKKHSLDDLARLVYGANTPTYRDNVRKHLPTQRNYMLGLMKPFITTYGPRGVVEGIKFYEKDNADDRDALNAELNRLVHRNELSHDRYMKLSTVLELAPPTIEPTS